MKRTHPAPDQVGLAERRTRFMALLVAREIPHQLHEDGEELSLLDGVVRVYPPYNLQSCSSENEIVLDRLRSLFQSLDEEELTEK